MEIQLISYLYTHEDKNMKSLTKKIFVKNSAYTEIEMKKSQFCLDTTEFPKYLRIQNITSTMLKMLIPVNRPRIPPTIKVKF